MKLFLDDMRQPPSQYEDNDWADWVVVRSVENAKQILQTGLVTDLSLDHDLGQDKSGMDLVKWMVDTGYWPSGNITIHSENQIGAENMQSLIDQATRHGLRNKE